MNNTANNTTNQSGWFIIIACLAIGLAPFSPEPHLFGKVKWIMGGANGMQPMDWWDTIMHGVPMIAFVVLLIRKLIKK
ncbi:hypothetical protein GYB57_00045 [bacterium]|jgi:hypothetical protein|nr:hypothetical protein [bacterium]